MDGLLINEQFGGQKDGRMDGWFDTIDGQTVQSIGRWIDSLIGWMDGWMEIYWKFLFYIVKTF